MFYSDKYKFVFLHQKKNAGTSIKSLVCSDIYKAKVYPERRHVALDEKTFLEFKGYRFFTTIRNPYDRISSWWGHLVNAAQKNGSHERFNSQKIVSFMDSIEWSLDRYIDLYRKKTTGSEFVLSTSQSDFISDFPVRILRFEAGINCEWKRFCVLNGMPYHPAKKINETPSGLKPNLTENQKEIIYDFFRCDFERFCYNK